jgi:hypothetical protein
MGLYPTSPRADFLSWANVHAPIFTAKAAQIGLTAPQAAAFAAAVEAASAAESDRAGATQAAKTATQDATMKVSDLRRSASATVGLIKAFAQQTDNPNVYNLAEIPAPATPTPVPPPALPTDLSVSLIPTTGQIELRWKAANPVGSSGTAYIVRRRIAATGPFEFLGVTGEKRFVDSTFAAGPDRVEYTVQGQRADSSGPVSNIVVVNFGVPGPTGAANLSYAIGPAPSPESQMPAKLAA